jgi:chromosome segregation ATPase
MEHTKKNILTFRSKHTIKSLLFTSFLAGMLGCTSSNKAELEDSDLENLSSKLTKLAEEKTKAEAELSKTAQEKTKLEQANNQTAKDLETVNRDLKNATNKIGNLKLKKGQKKQEEKRLKKKEEGKKLQEEIEKKTENKKTALTTAEKKFNKCKEKVRELNEERDELTVHIDQCGQQMTGYNEEKKQTSNSLKECQEALVENSNKSKALQQLLFVAKRLKTKNIEECIAAEEKTIQTIEKKITELTGKPKQTFAFFPGHSIEKEREKLAKHNQKLEDLSKIKDLNEKPDAKKLSASVGIEVKNCEVARAELKQKKKSCKLELDKIEAKIENIKAKILNGEEKLKDIEQEIKAAVKKKGKLSEKVETLQDNF